MNCFYAQILNRTLSLAICGLFLSTSQLSLASSLNLIEAWELAKNADTQWLSLQKSFVAREEIKAQARAALLPRLSTQYSRSKVDTNIQQSTFSQDFDGTSENLSVSISQPLLNLPAIQGYKASQLELDVIKLERKAALQSLKLRLAQAYFDVLSAYESKKLAASEQKAIARQLDQTQQRFKVGLVSKTDVLEAQAAYDQTQVSLALADNEITIARENLSIIIGTHFEKVQDLDKNLAFDWTMPPQSEWVDKVIENNYNLGIAQHQLNQARLDYKSIQASYWPTVDAVAAYSDSDGASQTESQSIGIEANWVPFQGGGLASRVRQARLNFEKAKKDLSGSEIRLRRDANNLYKTLETDVVRITAQEQAMLSSASALEATQAGYEVGTRNIVDVLQAQRSLFNAKKDLALAKYAYIINGLRAADLVGDLNPQKLEKVVSWSQQQTVQP